MNHETISDTLNKRPFRPFILQMNDGRTFPINHPDSVIASKRDVSLVLPDNSVIHLEPLLIATLHESPWKTPE